jgi:hypothetical protein
MIEGVGVYYILKRNGEVGKVLWRGSNLSATGTSRAVLGCNFPSPHGRRERKKARRKKERQVECVHLLQLEDCYFNTHLSIKKLAYLCIDSSLHVILVRCTGACMSCDGCATESDRSVS